MPVCTLNAPMNLNAGGEKLWQFGAGQYVFDAGTAYSQYVSGFLLNGKPGMDSDVLTSPGPPVILDFPRPNTTWQPPGSGFVPQAAEPVRIAEAVPYAVRAVPLDPGDPRVAQFVSGK